MKNKILTKEEAEVVKELKAKYHDNNDTYSKELEKYLKSIHFDDRLAEYLDNKWYIKILRFIFNRKKKVKE